MGSFFSTFETVILVFHFIFAFFLITVILLQSGKGTDIGAAFGAGGSASLFGASGGSTVLTKLTTAIAILFLLTSISLATSANYVATGGASESLVSDELKELNNKEDSVPQQIPIQ